MGGLFFDVPHTLGRVLDGLRASLDGRKLKKSFAQTRAVAEHCAAFSRPWDFGTAPCFLFEERAEKRV